MGSDTYKSTLTTTNHETLLTASNDGTIHVHNHADHAPLNITPSTNPSPCSSMPRGSIATNHLVSRSSNATPFSVTRRLKTNEIMLSKVSVIISVMFIICHSIRFVPNIYELIARFHVNAGDTSFVLWPDWVEGFTFFSHLLTVLNASINFYIYYFARYKINTMNCFSGFCTTKENRSPTIGLMQL